MNNKLKIGLLLLVAALITVSGVSALPSYAPGATNPAHRTAAAPGCAGSCHNMPVFCAQCHAYPYATPNATATPTETPVSDIIPPATTLSGVTENSSFNNSVTITLNATDNAGGSGVNETIYMVNGGATVTYSAPFVVDIIGQDNVSYWSTDNAGNVEPQNMVNFTIGNISIEDTTAPTTTISGVTENGSFNNSVTITLNATDNAGGSGVNETIYMVNGGPTITYSAPFVVDTIGQDNVSYWSTDNAGNVEPQNMVNFTIGNVSIEDTTAPTTTISGVTENGSFNNSVTITLNATDNAGGSGVNETIYMVNGGATTTYSAPFVVNTIGQDNVSYWSTDNAGNVEPLNMVNFTIGNIPEVNATATREIGRKSILPGESTNITVRIAGITNAIGLHEIPPQGWNVTRGSDNADGFKNNTNEWVWINSDANKTVTYTMTAPMNISIGTYQIEGTIRDVNGTLANVEGDNSIKIDILEVYRRLGDDPAVVETGDLLSAFDDFRNNRAPAPFDRALNAEEVAELINEWINS